MTGERVSPGGGVDRPLALVALGLTALLVYVVWPVIAAIAVGGVLAIVIYPPFERLVAGLRGRRALATWLTTLALIVALLVPLGLLTYYALMQALQGIAWISAEIRAAGGVLGAVERLPGWLQGPASRLARGEGAGLGALGSQATAVVERLASSFGNVAAQGFLMLVIVFYLLLYGPAYVDFVRRVSPLRPQHTDDFIQEFRAVARALFWGNLVTALGQAAAATVGYVIVGVPSAVFFGALTLFASFVPVVGTAIVWLPMALVLLLLDRTVAGLVLIGWSVVVVGSVDNLLRPLLSRLGTTVPNLLLFTTIFGGIMVFGLKGLLLGPLFGSLALTALRLVEREQRRALGDDSIVTP